MTRPYSYTNLGDCVEVLDSMRRPVNGSERVSRNAGKDRSSLYPYYGATGQVDFIDDYLFDEELLILGEDGVPFFEEGRAKSYIIRGKTWVNNHAHVLRARSKITSNSFLSYYLNQFNYRGYVTGTTRTKLTQAKLREIPIPLPPPSEQDRIVEILDQADTLRQQRRQADALSQRILPALFHEMFGDPNRNEREWPTLPLDVAFDDVSRKGNKIPRSEYLTAGKIPVIDQGQDAIAGYWDEVGDAYRGKLPVTLFGDHTRIFKLLEHPFCIGADGVRLLRPKTMDCHFAFGLLTLLDVPSRGYSRHFKELRSLTYIDPPQALQERFGNAVAELRQLTAKAATSAATLETLFQTLLHRAFDGSLTAKWREGHAKELLQEMAHQA